MEDSRERNDIPSLPFALCLALGWHGGTLFVLFPNRRDFGRVWITSSVHTWMYLGLGCVTWEDLDGVFAR